MDINIEELAKEMPEFNSHKEASEWFGSKFPGNFIFKEKDVFNDIPAYFYHIVKNANGYNNYMNSLSEETGEIDSTVPFHTYTTVIISENGDVEISL